MKKFLEALRLYFNISPAKALKVGLVEFEATVKKVREAGETPTRGTMVAITALTAALGIPVTASEEATAAIEASLNAAARYRDAAKSEAAALKNEVAILRDLIMRKTAASENKQASMVSIASNNDARANELKGLTTLL